MARLELTLRRCASLGLTLTAFAGGMDAVYYGRQECPLGHQDAPGGKQLHVELAEILGELPPPDCSCRILLTANDEQAALEFHLTAPCTWLAEAQEALEQRSVLNALHGLVRYALWNQKTTELNPNVHADLHAVFQALVRRLDEQLCVPGDTLGERLGVVRALHIWVDRTYCTYASSPGATHLGRPYRIITGVTGLLATGQRLDAYRVLNTLAPGQRYPAEYKTMPLEKRPDAATLLTGDRYGRYAAVADLLNTVDMDALAAPLRAGDAQEPSGLLVGLPTSEGEMSVGTVGSLLAPFLLDTPTTWLRDTVATQGWRPGSPDWRVSRAGVYARRGIVNLATAGVYDTVTSGVYDTVTLQDVTELGLTDRAHWLALFTLWPNLGDVDVSAAAEVVQGLFAA